MNLGITFKIHESNLAIQTFRTSFGFGKKRKRVIFLPWKPHPFYSDLMGFYSDLMGFYVANSSDLQSHPDTPFVSTLHGPWQCARPVHGQARNDPQDSCALCGSCRHEVVHHHPDTWPQAKVRKPHTQWEMFKAAMQLHKEGRYAMICSST